LSEYTGANHVSNRHKIQRAPGLQQLQIQRRRHRLHNQRKETLQSEVRQGGGEKDRAAEGERGGRAAW